MSFEIEDNLKEITGMIKEKPHRVMNVLGQQLVKEIRPNVKFKNKSGRKFMRATLGSWARQHERDLQIGFRDPERISFLRNTNAPFHKFKWLYDEVDDPIRSVVVKNIPNIQKLIGEALDEIRKE